jgi:hypothetical protein
MLGRTELQGPLDANKEISVSLGREDNENK